MLIFFQITGFIEKDRFPDSLDSLRFCRTMEKVGLVFFVTPAFIFRKFGRTRFNFRISMVLVLQPGLPWGFSSLEDNWVGVAQGSGSLRTGGAVPPVDEAVSPRTWSSAPQPIDC